MAPTRSRSPSPRGQIVAGAASETTPLLNGTSSLPIPHDAAQQKHKKKSSYNGISGGGPPTSSEASDDTSASSSSADKPLPKLQIILLCVVRMTEPIAFFGVFPYIAQMVQRNGHLPPADVGFYSGLIESLFSATQMFVLVAWGRLADRLGRKPVLVASLLGMAVGPALFGLSTTLGQMIAFRCLAGVFSGSSLIIRTMISEHSTVDTQARAFSFFSFGGNVGIFLGPLIGGALADPAEQYPAVFAGIPFFETYPYALAGFATGLVSLVVAIVCVFFLEETLDRSQWETSSPSNESDQDSNDPKRSTWRRIRAFTVRFILSIHGAAAFLAGTGGDDPAEMSIWQLVRAPGVAYVLWIYGHVMLLAFAFTAIIPVALYTPVVLGGLGFSTSLISAYMASQGASQALWLLLAFPFLQRRFGTRAVMFGCGVAYPFFFAGYILLNALLRDGSEPARVWFWIIGCFVAFVGPGISMAFTGAQLALNDVSPDPRVLGTLNAVALTVSSGIRALAPGASTAIYAIGVRNQILGGHLAWVLLIPLSATYGVAAKWLPERRKPRPARVAAEEAA
jgi:MFS family permease